MFSPGTVLREKYEAFKDLLEYDKQAHDFMAELEDIFYNQKKYDFQTVIKTYDQFATSVSGMVEELLKMCPSNYWSLKDYFKKFDFYIRFMLAPPALEFSPPFTIAFDQISTFEEAIAGKKAFCLSHLNKELHLPTPNGFIHRSLAQAMYYSQGIFAGEAHPLEKSKHNKLNPLQQITYLAILNILLPAQIITGILIWGLQRWPHIAAELGGLPVLALVHTLVAWAFATFIVMHIYLTTTGHSPIAGIKSMVGGFDNVEKHTGGPESDGSQGELK